MRQSSFSARLASKLNKLYRKLNDRQMEYAGVLTDAIRVKVDRTTTRDTASRKIVGLDLINVIFPRMEDIPMRKITRTDGSTQNSIYGKQGEPFLLAAPVKFNIDIDDLIVKLYEDTSADLTPWVVVFQVKDMLGTFGDRSILYQKIQCTYFDEDLPEQVVTFITNMAQRRETEELGW